MSCAKAIQKEMKSRGWKADLLDPYTLESKYLAKAVGDVYVDTVQISPTLFERIYELGEGYDWLEKKLNLPDPVLEIQKHIADLLEIYLEQNHYDIIICTHPYPGFMLTILKRKQVSIPANILVATDYTCIPFEEDVKADWDCIGTKLIEQEFTSKGVEASHILPFGIPVDPDYEITLDRNTACKELQLDPSKRYIILSGGSMGSNTIKDALSVLEKYICQKEDLYLIVLCGSNEHLYQWLVDKSSCRVMPVPFTDKVREYLAAGEVYITKPGGLSITEACAVGIPMILCDPIPGCETRNAALFEQQGLACYAKNHTEIRNCLHRLLNPRAAGQMILAQRTILPHHNAKALCDFACEAAYLHQKQKQS